MFYKKLLGNNLLSLINSFTLYQVALKKRDMYPASVIAYKFVKKGIDEGMAVTQMKLQKLVYFAHGFYLAKHKNSPLIKEKFEVWEYGPVIREIYSEYKIYGSELIRDTEYLFMFGGDDKKKEFEMSLSKEAQDIIDLTWNALKDVDILTLSAWTHQEDSPWKKYYKNGTIPNNEIGEYFLLKFQIKKVDIHCI